MENGIEEILKEHEALCSRVFHLLNTGNPQTKDIELIIPKVKELFGMLEAVNTKQITAQQYNGLLNVMSEWNAIFSYFNIKMVYNFLFLLYVKLPLTEIRFLPD